MRASVPPTGPRDAALPGPVATVVILAGAALFIVASWGLIAQACLWLLS